MAFAPAVIAALPTILTVASTAIGVVGVLSSASANAQAMNYQAMVAERQEEINKQNADRAIATSQQQQAEQDDQTRALLGEQIAAQSASGLRLGGGSAMLTRKSARELGRLDALNIRQAGEVEAYNWKVGAQDAALAAGFSKMQANNSLTEGFLTGAGTLIGGMSKLNFPKTTSTSVLGGSKAVATKLRFS
jgi:hypothetical protein